MVAGKVTRAMCGHLNVSCVNPYEFIRKYRCLSCGEVIMCACEEDFARQFLPHQLREGTELDTQRRIPVTLGFKPDVCNTCRGIPEEAHPTAPRYGNSSKIARYYWREIWFETTRRYAKWTEIHAGGDAGTALTLDRELRKRIEREVIEEIKAQHRLNPKYTFKEESQQEILTRNQVDVVNLDGTYVKKTHGKAALFHCGQTYSVEEFAALHFEQQGYEVLKTESIPFHALFGIYF